MGQSLDGPDFARLETKEEWKAVLGAHAFRSACSSSWMLSQSGFLALRRRRCLKTYDLAKFPTSRMFLLMKQHFISPYYVQGRQLFLIGKTADLVDLFGGPENLLENLSQNQS
jgi:hypothetical protein